MAESEDWRRQRAMQLGLEPIADVSVQSQPAHPRRAAGSRSQPLEVDAGTIGDGVYRMRPPYVGNAAVPQVALSANPSRQHETNRPVRPPRAEPQSTADTTASPSSAVRAPAQITQKRTWPYFAGAALIAATAAGWFVEQQIGSARPERGSAAIAPARSIAPAATIPAAQWVGSPYHSSSLPAISAVVELPSCAEPALVDELRGVVTEQLRRSGLLRTEFKAAVEIAKARVRIAEAGSSLTVCTAALRLRRSTRKPANFDLDYAVRRLSGSQVQVVPLGLEHVVERIQTDDLDIQARVASSGAGAAVIPAPLAGTAAGSASGQDTRGSSKIVAVSKLTSALPTTAPSERRVFSTAAAPVAPTSDLLVRVPKVVHGCEQPATESVAITCSSPSLLALNAQVTAVLAALDRPGNTIELARIKRHADQHFDRCRTASCVTDAYHYWLGALDKIRRYEADFGSAGLDSPVKERPDAQ